MARSIAVKNGTEIEEIDAPVDENNEDSAEFVLSVAGQTDERWFFTVCKYDKDAPQGEYRVIRSQTLAELGDIDDRLRDGYGTGKYGIKVYRIPKGTNKQVLFKRWDIGVMAAAKPAVIQQAPSEMGAVLAAFDKLNSRMEAMFLRQLQPATPAAAVSDPINAVTQIVAAMKGLNDMMGPKTDPATSMGAAILQGIEIANKARGEVSGEGGETSWMDLIREFIKNGGVEIMSRQQPMNGVKQPTPQKIAPPFPAPVPTPAQPAPQPMKPNEQQVLANARQGIMSLIPLAARGSDPRLYAEVVLDSWPREVIVSVLQQPNPIQLMQQLVPESVPYVPWFQKLIAEIKEMMNDAGASESASDASPDLSPVQPIGNTGWVGGGESDT
jgi:hypothetical protein